MSRAALYLVRRSLEGRFTVDLAPCVVLPPGDEAWMEGRLAAVRQCISEFWGVVLGYNLVGTTDLFFFLCTHTGEGGPMLLSVRELVVPVRYRDGTVAALLVEDARRGRRKRRPKAAGARAAAEAANVSSPPPPSSQAEPEELGAWGAFSEARVSRIQEVANRVLGAALKDTLISDEVGGWVDWISGCMLLCVYGCVYWGLGSSAGPY